MTDPTEPSSFFAPAEPAGDLPAVESDADADQLTDRAPVDVHEESTPLAPAFLDEPGPGSPAHFGGTATEQAFDELPEGPANAIPATDETAPAPDEELATPRAEPTPTEPALSPTAPTPPVYRSPTGAAPLAPGEPGTAGAALAGLGAGLDLGGSYGEEYARPYAATPPWSNDRLEAIMRDTIDAQAQEQRQLEQLLVDVRGALLSMPSPAEVGTGADVVEAIEGLRAELSAVREAQATAHAQLSTRLDALTPTPPGPGEPSLQDVHDGLAGVRTDMSALPELIGPAVASAVAHGVAETNRQVAALHEAVDTASSPAGELRPLLDQLSEQIAPLAGLTGVLQQLSDRVAALEAASHVSSPDVGTVLDERLTERLDAFGAGLGERMDALEALQGSARDDLTAMRLAQEGPAGVAPTLLAQLHASEQRLAHHVDEAVLALAQAVLRRRPGATAVPAAPPPPLSPAPPEAPPAPAGQGLVFEPGPPTGEVAPITDAVVAAHEAALEIALEVAADDGWAEDNDDETPEWGKRAARRVGTAPVADETDEELFEHLAAWSKDDEPAPRGEFPGAAGDPGAGRRDEAAGDLPGLFPADEEFGAQGKWTADAADELDGDPSALAAEASAELPAHGSAQLPAGAPGQSATASRLSPLEPPGKRGLFRRRG